MNNPNKHKPLSSEEFFQLLDKQSSTEINYDGMDDFEKDALEGFTENVTIEKAKDLTEEVNAAISTKVTSTSSVATTTKNRVIWFSAAASIVLIIMISVFFLNESKDESNIALNETPKNEITIPEVLPAQEPNIVTEGNIETQSTNAVSSELTKNKALQPIESKSAESEAKGPLFDKEALGENKPANGGLAQSRKDVLKDGDFKNSNNSDEVNQQTIVLTDKLEANKKVQVSREEFESANDVSIAQNVTTISASSGSAQKADIDSKKEERVVKEKAKKSARDDTDGLISASKISPASAPSEQIKNAFYNGGELAIKEYVINYFKEKNITVPLKGKFKITGIVNSMGVLNVNSLTQITKEYCGCEEQIKSALNTMKKWSPVTDEGKSSSSTVEFILMF